MLSRWCRPARSSIFARPGFSERHALALASPQLGCGAERRCKHWSRYSSCECSGPAVGATPKLRFPRDDDRVTDRRRSQYEVCSEGAQALEAFGEKRPGPGCPASCAGASKAHQVLRRHNLRDAVMLVQALQWCRFAGCAAPERETQLDSASKSEEPSFLVCAVEATL